MLRFRDYIWFPLRDFEALSCSQALQIEMMRCANKLLEFGHSKRACARK